MKIESFEDLEIWQAARSVCKLIYLKSSEDSFKKDFDLVRQIRRSSGSCMDNIAEGFERGGNKELIQFLFIAKGSIGETRSQLSRALDLKYISKDDFDQLKEECLMISKKISGFIKYLKNSEFKGTKYHSGES
ncbi:four helix bundle protein [Reichenbachiella faecimaris]|uniref:Four helix bundle protein n=1 Tax=Reichenbachiella faecimaris TaxID=692418 RepID=A0A1W2GIN7_REIFA|nr:four helix bundle protein [Reichenbachiella faecimaris]SMD36515.1 four helix bundle protein [Reichenbachiella faecimaris]